MSDLTKLKPDHVRAAFEGRPGQSLSHAELYRALEDSGVDVSGSKQQVGDVLRYLVRWSYLEKGKEDGVIRYTRTGRSKGRQSRLPPGEAERRRRERDRMKKIAQRAALQPRERRVDSNTVARPKPVKAAPFCGPAETVEQFRARGGKIERLTTHWEQMERAA